MAARVTLVCTVLSLVLSIGAAQEPKSDDAKKIQGTWKIVSMSIGKEKPGIDITKLRLRFTENQIIAVFEFDGKEKKEKDDSKFRLDSTKKHFDVIDVAIREDGKRKEIIRPGIYELKGDELKICWAVERHPKKDKDGTITDKGTPATRPTEFKAGEDRVLLILKRDK